MKITMSGVKQKYRKEQNIYPSSGFSQRKEDASGKVTRYKARLVCKGFCQKPGVDFNSTYAPVCRLSTFRISLVTAVFLGMKIMQYYVEMAFLNGNLDEENFIEKPKGLQTRNGSVLRLHKALYGLKKAARQWNLTITNILEDLGLISSKKETCLFRKQEGLMVLLYVDDSLIAASSEEKCAHVATRLSRQVALKSLGDVQNVLEHQIFMNQEAGSLERSMPGIVKHMTSSIKLKKIQRTPLTTNSVDGGNPISDITSYRSEVGKLMWLASCVRPEISNPVRALAEKFAAPLESDRESSRRVREYLSSTLNFVLTLRPSLGT